MSEVKENAERKKQAQAGLQGQHMEARDGLDGKKNFTRSKMGLERAEGSAHNPNIEQQNGGGNFTAGERIGTYLGSQRSAEPVATGFFGGSNRAEKCGSVKGPWRQAMGCGCRIFPEQSRSPRCHDRGCGKFPAFGRASRAPGCPAWHKVRG